MSCILYKLMMWMCCQLSVFLFDLGICPMVSFIWTNLPYYTWHHYNPDLFWCFRNTNVQSKCSLCVAAYVCDADSRSEVGSIPSSYNVTRFWPRSSDVTNTSYIYHSVKWTVAVQLYKDFDGNDTIINFIAGQSFQF